MSSEESLLSPGARIPVRLLVNFLYFSSCFLKSSFLFRSWRRYSWNAHVRAVGHCRYFMHARKVHTSCMLYVSLGQTSNRHSRNDPGGRLFSTFLMRTLLSTIPSAYKNPPTSKFLALSDDPSDGGQKNKDTQSPNLSIPSDRRSNNSNAISPH